MPVRSCTFFRVFELIFIQEWCAFRTGIREIRDVRRGNSFSYNTIYLFFLCVGHHRCGHDRILQSGRSSKQVSTKATVCFLWHFKVQRLKTRAHEVEKGETTVPSCYVFIMQCQRLFVLKCYSFRTIIRIFLSYHLAVKRTRICSGCPFVLL